MNTLSKSLLFALGMTILAQRALLAAEPDPREKLATAIPEAIRMLEAKEYEGFFKKFVSPADLEKIPPNVLSDIMKKFGEEKAGRLLDVLNAIKGETPELDGDGKIATYKLDAEKFGKGEIRFGKVDGLWYLRN